MRAAIICLLYLLFLSSNAHAYLDAGTGSMLLQLIFGGAIAAMATIKIYWHKIISFFNKNTEQKCENEDEVETKID